MLRALFVSVTYCAIVFARKYDVKSDEGVKNFAHSFDSPLDEDELSNWRSSGASVGTQESYVIVPAVSGRTGSFWHAEPLETDDFIVSFRIKSEVKKVNKNLNNEFGFWYTVDQKVSDVGDLAGQDRNFEGFGVTFEGNDKVSLYISDGENPVQQPAVTAKLDWLNRGEIDINVKVSPSRGIVISSRASNSGNRSKTLLKSQTPASHAAISKSRNKESTRLYPSRGFISFTGRSASTPDPDEAALIMVHEIEVRNFDLTKISNDELKDVDENVADALKKIQNLSSGGKKKRFSGKSRKNRQDNLSTTIDNEAVDIDGDEAASAHAHGTKKHLHEGHESESDDATVLTIEEEDLIIASVTDMLNKHASSIDARVRDQTRMARRIVQEVRDMRLTIKILKAQLMSVKSANNHLIIGGSHGDNSVISELREQVAQLQDDAIKRQEEYVATLESLHGDVKHSTEHLEVHHQREIEAMRQRNAKIRESIEGQGLFTKFAFGFAMAGIAIFAIFAYKKMAAIEKKHIL